MNIDDFVSDSIKSIIASGLFKKTSARDKVVGSFNGIQVRVGIEVEENIAVTFDGFRCRLMFSAALHCPMPTLGLIDPIRVSGRRFSEVFFLLPESVDNDAVLSLFSDDRILKDWSSAGNRQCPIMLSSSQVLLFFPPDISAQELVSHINTVSKLVSQFPFKGLIPGENARSLASTLELRPKKVPPDLRDSFAVACDWAIMNEEDLLDYAARHPEETRAFVRLFRQKLTLIEKWAPAPKKGSVSAEGSVFQVAMRNFAILNQKLATDV